MTSEQLHEIISHIEMLDRTFEVSLGGLSAGWWLQVTYWEPDIHTGTPELQKSRKWFIDDDATETDVVRTAHKAIECSYAHVISEHFKYKGRVVYGPHMSIDALIEASTKLDAK